MCFLAFMNIGGQELILILLLVLVLFGAKKLPELARGMGQAIKEFQKAKDEFGDELNKAGKPEPGGRSEPDVRAAQSTVPRIESSSPSSAARPDPNQSVAPGNKADQV